VALDLLGHQEEAEQSYRAALTLAPDNLPAANNLAMSLLLAGHAPEAVAILEPLARRAGAPPRVVANLAIARAATGDRVGARALLAGPSEYEDLNSILTGLAGGTVAPAEVSNQS
jgi:Flp pilus assembly protein TadD